MSLTQSQCVHLCILFQDAASALIASILMTVNKMDMQKSISALIAINDATRCRLFRSPRLHNKIDT